MPNPIAGAPLPTSWAGAAICTAIAVLCGCASSTTHAESTATSTAAPLFGGSVPRAIASDIDFVSLEGPYWVKDGGYLIFSDVVEENGNAAKIYRYDPKSGVFSVLPYPVTPTSTNGLGVTHDGQLYACERYNGVLARVIGNERHIVVERSPHADGLPLNAPNDLAIRSDGNVYFTDTTWGAQSRPHAPTGLYRVAPDGAVSMVLQMDMPNGVVLSPDETVLYVGSDAQDRLWKLPVATDGSVGPAIPFISPERVPDGKFDVPDGMCVDDLGRVYVTNNSDKVSAIQVFTKDAQYLGRIAFPQPPSNCTFGGTDRRSLFVTTLHAIYELRLDTPGLP